MKQVITSILLAYGILMCLNLIKTKSFDSSFHSVNNNSSFQQGKTLRSAYKNYFPIGAAITPKEDLTNPKIANFLKTQFSSLTPKTAMQPFWIHPKENYYNWVEADSLVAFAQKNDMMIRGHCLLYYRAKHMPDWFYWDGKKLASKTLLLQRIKDHITTVVSRYKGKVYCWDVVNEAISRKGDQLFWDDDQLYKIAGEDYISKAFQYAHTADPTAKLFYNDQFDNPAHAKKVFNFLKELKRKGIPIDGVGIQCHLRINGITGSLLQEYINMFTSIGLQVQITELDVSIYGTQFSDRISNYQYTSRIQNQQSLVYETVFDICRINKGKITGITFWGFADDYGPNSLTKRFNKKNYPFVFDSLFRPKDSFFKITSF